MDAGFFSTTARSTLPRLAEAAKVNPLPAEIVDAIALADAWAQTSREVVVPAADTLTVENVAQAVEDLSVTMSVDSAFQNARSAIGAVVAAKVCSASWEHMPTIVEKCAGRWKNIWLIAVNAHRAIDAALGTPDHAGAEELLQGNVSKQWHELTGAIAQLEEIVAILSLDSGNPYSRIPFDRELQLFAPETQAHLNALENAHIVYPGVDGIYTAAIRNNITSAPRRSVDTADVRQGLQDLAVIERSRRQLADEEDSKTVDGQRRLASRAAMRAAIEQGEAQEAARAGR